MKKMKKIKKNSKLTLEKETIANLGKPGMNQIKGGAYTKDHLVTIGPCLPTDGTCNCQE